MKIFVPILAATLFVVALVGVPAMTHKTDLAQAADVTYTWTGMGDATSWDDSHNWDVGGSYPDGNNDIAIISSTASAIATPAGDALTVKEIQTSGTFTGTITLGHNLNITNITLAAGVFTDNGKTVSLGGNATIDLYGVITSIVSTGSWIQTGNGNISFTGWAHANMLFNSYEINSGVTATITRYLACRKLIMPAGATLTSDHYLHYAVVRDISGDDAVDISPSADVYGFTLALYPRYQTNPPARVTFNQKAITMAANIGVGYSSNVTLNMTGNWSVGHLQYMGGQAATSEALEFIFDTNGYNMTLSSALYFSTIYGDPTKCFGKIYLRNGTHRIAGGIVRTQTSTSPSFIDFGSSTLYVGGKIDLYYADVVGTDASVIHLNGTVKQQITCAGEALHHLIVENNSTGGIEFTQNCSIGTLVDSTNNSRLVFKAGSAFNITNISLAGETNNNIHLESTSPGTEWLLNTTGNPQVSYLSVSDSNASGGSQIDASDCTNENLGNNTNWDFGSCGPVTPTTAATSSSDTTSGSSGTTTRRSTSFRGTDSEVVSVTTTPAAFAAISQQYLPEITVPKTVPAYGAIKIPIYYDPSIAVIVIVIDGNIYDLVPTQELAANDNIYYLKDLEPGNHRFQYYGIDNLNRHTPLSVIQDIFASRAVVGIMGFTFSLWWLALIIPVIVIIIIIQAWRKQKYLESLRGNVEAYGRGQY